MAWRGLGPWPRGANWGRAEFHLAGERCVVPVDVISVLRRWLVDVLDWLFALLECSTGQSESQQINQS